VLAVFVAYWPAMHGGFVCDDADDVQNNVALRSCSGLGAIWTEPGVNAQYYPLSFTSFWLNYQVGGLNPFGYHMVNVLLHAINALLLWRVLRVLKIPGAWLAAALFALHPVNVESVAYIDERKNVLSGCFFLCALFAAIKFWLPDGVVKKELKPAGPDARPSENDGSVSVAQQGSEPASPGAQDDSALCLGDSVANPFGSWKFYTLTFVLYLLALLSKTATLPLPAVILMMVWWRRRLTLRDVVWVIPLVLAGVGMGLVTMHLESHLVDNEQLWKLYGLDMTWPQRGLLAARDLWFYLGKLVWPHPLIFTYPHWTIRAADGLAYVPVVALTAGVWMLWRYRLGWGRAGLFALAYYVALLFLVLGFFNVYMFRFTLVSDHFQYLACMGPLTLAAAGITLALKRRQTQKMAPYMTPLFTGAPLLILSVMTWQQAGMFASAETLWKATLDRNPTCVMALVNLGDCKFRENRLDEAVDLANRALRLDPKSLQALNNLGNAFARRGQADQAIGYYRRALAISPRCAMATFNLANTLEKSGRFPEAIAAYEEALKYDPDAPQYLNNLAWLLATCPDDKSRNGARAVILATKACELTQSQEPVFIGTRAAAHAEAGEFYSAMLYAKMAMEVAEAQGKQGVVARNQQLLEQYYHLGKPYHEPPPVRKAGGGALDKSINRGINPL
jgi:tetratricopeptide (TPR) repeat protein